MKTLTHRSLIMWTIFICTTVVLWLLVKQHCAHVSARQAQTAEQAAIAALYPAHSHGEDIQGGTLLRVEAIQNGQEADAYFLDGPAHCRVHMTRLSKPVAGGAWRFAAPSCNIPG